MPHRLPAPLNHFIKGIQSAHSKASLERVLKSHAPILVQTSVLFTVLGGAALWVKGQSSEVGVLRVLWWITYLGAVGIATQLSKPISNSTSRPVTDLVPESGAVLIVCAAVIALLRFLPIYLGVIPALIYFTLTNSFFLIAFTKDMDFQDKLHWIERHPFSSAGVAFVPSLICWVLKPEIACCIWSLLLPVYTGILIDKERQRGVASFEADIEPAGPVETNVQLPIFGLVKPVWTFLSSLLALIDTELLNVGTRNYAKELNMSAVDNDYAGLRYNHNSALGSGFTERPLSAYALSETSDLKKNPLTSGAKVMSPPPLAASSTGDYYIKRRKKKD